MRAASAWSTYEPIVGNADASPPGKDGKTIEEPCDLILFRERFSWLRVPDRLPLVGELATGCNLPDKVAIVPICVSKSVLTFLGNKFADFLFK